VSERLKALAGSCPAAQGVAVLVVDVLCLCWAVEGSASLKLE
jgi:hypothetical protein